MPSEYPITEFLSLIKDTREQLAYLHELGVTNVETGSKASSPSKQAVANEPNWPDTNESSDSYGPRTQGFPTIATAVRVSGASDMTPPFASASLPQDTLFGDIAAPPPLIEKSSESFEQIWSDIGDCTRCPL